jgi:hypothetical protein
MVPPVLDSLDRIRAAAGQLAAGACQSPSPFVTFPRISRTPKLLIGQGDSTKIAIPEKVFFADRCYARELLPPVAGQWRH